MPKLRVLSARELLRFFELQGFVIDRQRGSHITMIRQVGVARLPLLIPNHQDIAKGTLKEIYKQAEKVIDQKLLDGFFYTK